MNLAALQHVPVALGAAVMGLGGLALCWQRAHQMLGTPASIGIALLVLAVLFFIVVVVAYGVKVIRHPANARADFNHPIRLSFFATFTISLMVLAVGILPLSPGLASGLWWAGAALHLPLTLHSLHYWIECDCKAPMMTPIWFIPVVGTLVAPIAGVEFAPLELNRMFFAVGLLFWLVLLTLLMQRLLFGEVLAGKLMPTLFILMAPPAIGCLAWYRISGEWGLIGDMLYGLALFFALLLMMKWRHFIAMPFALSWWALTFPSAALTLATLLQAHLKPQSALWLPLATALLIVTTLLVALTMWHTLRALRSGALFAPEA